MLVYAIEIFAIVNLAAVGASHLLRPQSWVEFYSWLRGHGQAGVFAIALPPLSFGSLVAAFHPIWTGIPAVLTILGWAQVVKALLYLLFPEYALRKLALVTRERGWYFMAAGAVLLALAALLAFHLALLTSPPVAA